MGVGRQVQHCGVRDCPVSGAHAAALAAGCCCKPAPDGPVDPAGCPQIGNTQPRTPADSVIDGITVSFGLESRTVLQNTDSVGFNSPCITFPPPVFTEEAIASVSSGLATWNGAAWEGCAQGSASVTSLQHGISGRPCGTRCTCLNNSPGCFLIPCCGDAYQIPRQYQSPFVTYSQSDVILPRQVACPDCCGGLGVIDTGYNGAQWLGGGSLAIRYGCVNFAELFGINPCECAGGAGGTALGYAIYASLRIVSQNAIAEGSPLCTAPFLGLPSSASFSRHAGLWVKPCCSASDSVRGTYYLAIPQASSGTSGTYSWLTTRSATATVS